MKDRIKNYMQSKMPEAEDLIISNIVKLPVYARENFTFDAEWREGGRKITKSFFLRRDPTGTLLESDRETEYRILKSLEPSPIPVPKVYWLETDESLDRSFIIMEKVEGWTAEIGQVLEDHELREKIVEQFVEELARIHTVDWNSLGLSFLGVPNRGTDAAEREIRKWEAVINKQKLGPQPVLTEALHWLEDNKPEAERISLVHGDYRPDNMVFRYGEVAAIVDWEMAYLGDPMSDLGWVCMKAWRGESPLMCGLIEREKLFSKYESLTGRRVNEESVAFYEVLGNFKLAAVDLTGMRGFSEGRTHDVGFALLGFDHPRLLNEVAKGIGI